MRDLTVANWGDVQMDGKRPGKGRSIDRPSTYFLLKASSGRYDGVTCSYILLRNNPRDARDEGAFFSSCAPLLVDIESHLDFAGLDTGRHNSCRGEHWDCRFQSARHILHILEVALLSSPYL